MDVALRTLADAGLALDAAQEALEAGEATAAEEHLDLAGEALETLRAAWPDLPPAGRAIVGPAGKEVRERREALVKRLPKRRALSEGTPEEAQEVLDSVDGFHPLGRRGQPSYVVDAIAFLAGDGARWITGTTLPVDGGVLAGRSPALQAETAAA